MVKQVISDREEAAAAARSDIRYKGVRKRKWGKWVSEIRLPNSRERIWLGSYDSSVKAARAFDAALFCLRGATAKFNFPDNPPEIDGGRSLTSSQIQAAAARFANSDIASTARMEQSTSDFQTGGYSSPSVSDGTTLQVELDSGDSTPGGSFSDLLHTGSGNFRFDYGYLPGVDEYSGYFLGGSSLIFDYNEENFEEVVAQDPFLWNF